MFDAACETVNLFFFLPLEVALAVHTLPLKCAQTQHFGEMEQSCDLTSGFDVDAHSHTVRPRHSSKFSHRVRCWEIHIVRKLLIYVNIFSILLIYVAHHTYTHTAYVFPTVNTVFFHTFSMWNYKKYEISSFRHVSLSFSKFKLAEFWMACQRSTPTLPPSLPSFVPTPILCMSAQEPIQ